MCILFFSGWLSIAYITNPWAPVEETTTTEGETRSKGRQEGDGER